MPGFPPYEEDIADLFRQAGELLAAHFDEVRARGPIDRFASPAELAPSYAAPLPPDGRPIEAVWEDLRRILREGVALHHPACLGHQVAPAFPLAAAGGAIAQAVNQAVAAWEGAPSAAHLERQVLRWFSDLAGFGPDAAGSFVTGGSIANLTGILAARSRDGSAWEAGVDPAKRPAVLCSDQVHYSIERACGVLGLGSRSVVKVPTDDRLRMTPEAVEASLAACRKEGRNPIALVATAGTTSTGSFDPLRPLARIARREKLWFHVDGAHGASFLFSERHRGLLDGIEMADSLAWDPHKMLFMPMSASVILFARSPDMDRLFRQEAPYIFGTSGDIPPEMNAGERMLACSRPWDALKIWLSLTRHGARVFGEMIDTTVETAAGLHARVRAAPDFEPLHAPEANILCFRYRWDNASAEALDAFNYDLRNRLNRSGKAWITTAVVKGKRALRTAVMNPLTGRAEIEGLLAELRRIARGMRESGTIARS